MDCVHPSLAAEPLNQRPKSAAAPSPPMAKKMGGGQDGVITPDSLSGEATFASLTDIVASSATRHSPPAVGVVGCTSVAATGQVRAPCTPPASPPSIAKAPGESAGTPTRPTPLSPRRRASLSSVEAPAAAPESPVSASARINSSPASSSSAPAAAAPAPAPVPVAVSTVHFAQLPQAQQTLVLAYALEQQQHALQQQHMQAQHQLRAAMLHQEQEHAEQARRLNFSGEQIALLAKQRQEYYYQQQMRLQSHFQQQHLQQQQQPFRSAFYIPVPPQPSMVAGTTTTSATTTTAAETSAPAAVPPPPPAAPTASSGPASAEDCNDSSSSSSSAAAAAAADARASPSPLPSMTYADMIEEAIRSSPDKTMYLCEIYHYFETHFSGFHPDDKKWKNSVRHNLTIQARFERVQAGPDGGVHRVPFVGKARGAARLWTVIDAECAPLPPRTVARTPAPAAAAAGRGRTAAGIRGAAPVLVLSPMIACAEPHAMPTVTPMVEVRKRKFCIEDEDDSPDAPAEASAHHGARAQTLVGRLDFRTDSTGDSTSKRSRRSVDGSQAAAGPLLQPPSTPVAGTTQDGVVPLTPRYHIAEALLALAQG